LELHKKDDANGAYDDGIYQIFDTSKPKHISFRMSTDSPDVESCDLRLATMNRSSNTSSRYNKVEW
jgi:hypothetical protein